MSEGATIARERMREVGRVEIHAEPARLRPVHPALELRDGVGVAIHLPTREFRIAGVEIEPVAAGQQRKRLIQIGAEFIGRAGFAGIVACDGEPAAWFAARIFKTSHIVALPAVEGNGCGGERGERGLGIDTESGVGFAGEGIGGGAHRGGRS